MFAVVYDVGRLEAIVIYLHQNQNCYINGKAIALVKLPNNPNQIRSTNILITTQKSYLISSPLKSASVDC